MNSVTQISKLATINNQIASQEIEAGRKKGSVNLIAVSKTKSMDQIKPVIDEGHSHFGENKVQEALMKWQDLKKENQPALTRVHSACFTGDLLGSEKCDCGEQFSVSMSKMKNEGSGVLLYLNQEGRGIGLANKMRAYHLQNIGFDTVDANHRLGFEDDERDLEIAAKILKSLGVSDIKLMTNNPKKIELLTDNGITVKERVPLIVSMNPNNENYLKTKAKKSGHLF